MKKLILFLTIISASCTHTMLGAAFAQDERRIIDENLEVIRSACARSATQELKKNLTYLNFENPAHVVTSKSVEGIRGKEIFLVVMSKDMNYEWEIWILGKARDSRCRVNFSFTFDSLVTRQPLTTPMSYAGVRASTVSVGFMCIDGDKIILVEDPTLNAAEYRYDAQPV